MEYVILVLLGISGALGALLFRKNEQTKRLTNDIETHKFEVQAEKEKRALAIKQAAVKGAEYAAKKKVEEFRAKYGHLIKPDDESSNNGKGMPK